MPVSPSRRVAFDILLRVEQDAAFSTELLHAVSGNSGNAAGEAKLDSRDHGLATEIALGCLRRQGEIDHMLEKAAGRPVARLDPEVRAALRIGGYQLRYLDRVPARAAVSESVELVKMARKRSAAGFVNAVLRKLTPPDAEVQSAKPASSKPVSSGEDRLPTTPSLSLNYPPWLVRRWKAAYGDELAAGIIACGVTTPPVYLRLNPAFDPEQTLRLLSEDGVETEATELPLAWRVIRGRVHESRCFAEGRCRIQDLSSQCVVPLLELNATHSFLDVCAAPGGKTFQAIETRGNSRGIVAADRHLRRLRTLRGLALRGLAESRLPSANPPESIANAAHASAVSQIASAVSQIDCVALDAQLGLPFRHSFDRILVDAPCSGTGTLARNPEIKWRLIPEDIADLAAKQQAILGNALDLLAPGGLLVYATCSLEPEENQGVIEAVGKGRPNFELGAYFQRIPGREPGDGFFARQIRRRPGG